MLKKIGLALGSGGARGWAHIGVLRALEEADIEVSYVAGTSIGAVVGALYASGELDALEDFAHHIDWKTIVSLLDVVFPQQGLLDGEKIYDLLSEHLRKRRMEDTLIPLCCVSTNLSTRQAVHIREGLMVDAVRASFSLPGIFTPVQLEESYLVDGGLVNPLPIDAVREMGADIVLAVDLNNSVLPSEMPPNQKSFAVEAKESSAEQSLRKQSQTLGYNRFEQVYKDIQATVSDKIHQWMPFDDEPKPNIFDILGYSIDVMEEKLTRSNMETHKPDILIEIELKQMAMFDFHCAPHAIQAGYIQTKRILPEIQDQLLLN